MADDGSDFLDSIDFDIDGGAGLDDFPEFGLDGLGAPVAGAQVVGAMELVVADPGAGQPGVDDWDELEWALHIWGIAELPVDDDPVVAEREALTRYRDGNPVQHEGVDMEHHVVQSASGLLEGHLSQKVSDGAVQAQLDAQVSIYFV